MMIFRKRFIYSSFLFLTVAVLLSGCIKPMLPPQVTLQLSRTETASVRGKTIVIDPGHGGPERGAIGNNGLHEAEVNLGVALYLWGFLKDAGAYPVLTRTTDSCVDQTEPFDLKHELHARAEISNQSNADLFVSIHHNADPRNRRRNDLIVFYKMSDPGQSRDIARDVCAALTQHLKPEKASIQPGNFHVLRATKAPAILGEASFITTKDTATLLSYHRTLAREAAAYFHGICTYFQKGVPRITACTPDNATLAHPQPQIRCRVSPGTDNATVVPGSVVFTLDGEQLASCSLTGDEVIARPAQPLANSRHQYCVRVRNSNGNSSSRFCGSFTVALPAHSIKIEPYFSTVPPDLQTALPITVQVRDELNRPVADGTAVFLATTAGRIEPDQTVTTDGWALALLSADPKKTKTVISARCGDAFAETTLDIGVRPEALFLARIQDAAGMPVPQAELVRDEQTKATSDRFGFVHDSVHSSGDYQYRIQKKGYLPVDLPVYLETGKLCSQSIQLAAVDSGLFFNRVIMLDPKQPSDLVKAVTEELAARIDAAGGSAVFSWTDLPEPPDAPRTLRASKARADVFIRLTPAKQPRVFYYYKSLPGETLATLIATRLAGRPGVSKHPWRAEPGAEYVLSHTEMTAVTVALPDNAGDGAKRVAEEVYKALREFLEHQRQERSMVQGSENTSYLRSP